MPDTPDLTPPPEQPMPDKARAHIRDQLAAATAGDDIGHGSRGVTGRWGHWTTPAIAAAAVVAVVLGAFAVRATQDNSSGPGRGSLQPAATSTGAPGTPTAGTESTPTPSHAQRATPTPTASVTNMLPVPPETTTVMAEPGPDNPNYTLPPTATPSPGAETGSPTPREPPTAEPPPSTVGPGNPFPDLPDKSVSCDEEVKEQANLEPSLRGAAVTTQRETDVGTIYLYETKEAWVVCDDSTAVPGGPQSEDGYTPTLVSFHLKSEDYRPTSQTLAISENWLGTLDTNGSAYFFAAGRDFDPPSVLAVSYKFPDGHTEEAVVGRNGLWSMSYLATEGVLADPKTNTFRLDPIKVTVQNDYDDFSVTFLEWGLDTCAQLNHGC